MPDVTTVQNFLLIGSAIFLSVVVLARSVLENKEGSEE